MEDLVICKREDLVSVADVIREASGTDDALVFPHGFVEPVAELGDRVVELGDRVVELGDRKTELEQQIEELEATVTELEACKADNSLAIEVFESRIASGDLRYLFSGCYALTTVPLFDTSKVTSMTGMFNDCRALTTVPLFDTSNVISMSSMFSGCYALTTVPLFDTSKVTSMVAMFTNCKSLTDCYLRNIKTNLQVGSGSTYGHLLTVDSLLHLIKELRDTGSFKTLTIGNVNLEKIANTYVKPVPITDEMRAEDDLIDEKLPFEICESTDDGAVLITDYVLEKNWQIK